MAFETAGVFVRARVRSGRQVESGVANGLRVGSVGWVSNCVAQLGTPGGGADAGAGPERRLKLHQATYHRQARQTRMRSGSLFPT